MALGVTRATHVSDFYSIINIIIYSINITLIIAIVTRSTCVCV